MLVFFWQLGDWGRGIKDPWPGDRRGQCDDGLVQALTEGLVKQQNSSAEWSMSASRGWGQTTEREGGGREQSCPFLGQSVTLDASQSEKKSHYLHVFSSIWISFIFFPFAQHAWLKCHALLLPPCIRLNKFLHGHTWELENFVFD